MQLASALAQSLNKLGIVKRWAMDSSDPAAGDSDTFMFTDSLDDANVVTSELKDGSGYHSVVIDLDMNAELVPSTTEGHFHLFIDTKLTWADYDLLLQTLASVGIIEPGYYSASKARGFTAVRLPWVKKETDVSPE